MRTVGNRGPTTLENYDFLEKISHFDRKRIPERVVHARGAGAHGYFETYGKAGDEPVATNQRGGQMQYKVDLGEKQNPRVNYEPSTLGGLKEAEQEGKEYTPHIEGRLVRESIDRRNDFKQAGETYNKFEEWEKNELISNLVSTLAPCDKRIQTKIIEYCTNADPEYGRRVEEGIRNYSSENTSSQEPIGAEGAENAPENALKKGHEADPY